MGVAASELFAAEGAEVAIIDRNGEAAAATAAAIRARGGDADGGALRHHQGDIRCNAVCPGFIRTPHGLREVADLDKLGVDVSDTALAAQQGRIGEP